MSKRSIGALFVKIDDGDLYDVPNWLRFETLVYETVHVIQDRRWIGE